MINLLNSPFYSTDLGSCDYDDTVFNGERFSWPETEAGFVANISCPLSSNMMTRECGLDRVWLQPNTSFCGNTAENISEILNQTNAENIISEIVKETVREITFVSPL